MKYFSEVKEICPKTGKVINIIPVEKLEYYKLRWDDFKIERSSYNRSNYIKGGYNNYQLGEDYTEYVIESVKNNNA